MEAIQKKIIIRIWIGLVILCCLGLSIVWLVFNVKDWSGTSEQVKSLIAWFFANFGSLTIGIIIKLFINKLNLKRIDNHLIESGVKPLSEIKKLNSESKNDLKDYFHYKDFHFKVGKRKIIITFNENSDRGQAYKDLKTALGEFVEKVRKDLPTQMI